MKKVVLAFLALSFLAFMACDNAELDYSGTWSGNLTDDEGASSVQGSSARITDGSTPSTIPIIITLIQNGSVLTGSATIGEGDAVVSGTVTAGEFSLELSIEMNGDDAGSITINGTFPSETSATGSYTAEGDISIVIGISGSFTLSKQ